MIQKKLGLLLLLVFALSATPKVFFHQLLANHTDGLVCNNTSKSNPCLHQQAFHCHFEDLVVAAPYVATTPELLLIKKEFLPLQQTYFHPSISILSPRHVDSRGPPVM